MRIGQFTNALEQQGWSVFWDRRIPAGQTWRSYIGQGLADARCVVVAWSRHSIASRWVVEEADEGQTRGILIPVLLDAVEPPIGFRSIQAADLTAWHADEPSHHFTRLVQDIHTILGRTPGPASTAPVVDPAAAAYPSPPGVRERLLGLSSRRFGLVAVPIIFALVAAGIYWSSRSQPSSPVNRGRSETPIVERSVPSPTGPSPAPPPTGPGRTAPSPTPAATGIAFFHGRWENIDPATRGLTRLAIRVSGTTLFVRAWGKCHPTDCEWGEVKGEAYAEGVSTDVRSDTRALGAVFKTDFNETTFVIRRQSDDQLRVESATRFTDQSGRSSFSMIDAFRRAR